MQDIFIQNGMHKTLWWETKTNGKRQKQAICAINLLVIACNLLFCKIPFKLNAHCILIRFPIIKTTYNIYTLTSDQMIDE